MRPRFWAPGMRPVSTLRLTRAGVECGTVMRFSLLIELTMRAWGIVCELALFAQKVLKARLKIAMK